MRTLEEVPEGATRWSVRSMAAAAGISPWSVHRIWRASGLKPHLLGEFKVSQDPPSLAFVPASILRAFGRPGN